MRHYSPLRVLSLLICLVYLYPAYARTWNPDVLGDGWQQTTISQGCDYSGSVVCTVVRHNPEPKAAAGVLYVHGYNDYFFQTEMADSIMAAHWAFYAVDLRKYGRSMLQENTPFEVRDLREYFADIDSALSVMKEDGIRYVALMGHSTGGLITSYYMASSSASTMVKALVLNSPFLDWNLGKIEWMVPAISKVGAIAPRLSIPQGSSSAYAESLLADHHGEWTYNTRWKKSTPMPVQAGWIRAIDTAQRWLRKHPRSISVPVLLMMSAKSVTGDRWTPEHNEADAVLDVKDIERDGVCLGNVITVLRINGGLHDLMLSAPPVRHAVERAVTDWLDALPFSPSKAPLPSSHASQHRAAQ